MKKITLIMILMTVLVYVNSAQTIEDALRYSSAKASITSRVSALGVSYHGILDDGGAIYYNPAGLTLIAKNEFSFGFGYNNINGKTDINNALNDFSVNKGYLSNISYAVPIRGTKKNAAIGIGYFYENSFDKTNEYNYYNTSSSIIADETYNGPQRALDNWAYELYLADFQNEKLTTDYNGNVLQDNFVEQTGGLHNITGAFGMDISDVFAIGFSVTTKWGKFNYYRDYEETDPNNVHQNKILGKELEKLELIEEYNTNIFGISGMLGLQARIGKFMRASLGIQLPTYYDFNEEFGKTYYAFFTDGSNSYWSPYQDNLNPSDYSMVSPFIYSAGLSGNLLGLTLSAGAEYCDVTQISFYNSAMELKEVNRDIKRNLSPQIRYGFGLEYKLPIIPVSILASYDNITTPYKDEPSEGAVSNLAFGASFFAGKSLRLDANLKLSNYSNKVLSYGSFNLPYYSDYIVKNDLINVTLGMSYRF